MSSLYQVQDLTVAWKGYSFPSSCVFCLWPIWYKSMRVILLKCGSHSGAPKLGSFQRSINVQTPQLWCPEPPPHLLRRLLTPPDFHFYSVNLPLCPASETGFRQFFFVSSIFSALPGWEKDFGHWKHYIQRQRSGLTLVSERLPLEESPRSRWVSVLGPHLTKLCPSALTRLASPCQVRGGQLRPRAHPLLQHPHQLPGLHAARRPLRRAALRDRLRAAPQARQRRELQRECGMAALEASASASASAPRSFVSPVSRAPFSLL